MYSKYKEWNMKISKQSKLHFFFQYFKQCICSTYTVSLKKILLIIERFNNLMLLTLHSILWTMILIKDRMELMLNLIITRLFIQETEVIQQLERWYFEIFISLNWFFLLKGVKQDKSAAFVTIRLVSDTPHAQIALCSHSLWLYTNKYKQY